MVVSVISPMAVAILKMTAILEKIQSTSLETTDARIAVNTAGVSPSNTVVSFVMILW